MTNMPSSFSTVCGEVAESCGAAGAAAGAEGAGGLPAGWVPESWPIAERLKIRAKAIWMWKEGLFHRRVISSFRIDLERWKSPWGVQLYLDFTPLTIVDGVLRSIPDHILVSQFDA